MDDIPVGIAEEVGEHVDDIPVGIAEEVGEHVDVDVDAGGAEGGHNGQDVVGGPTCYKCTCVYRDIKL